MADHDIAVGDGEVGTPEFALAAGVVTTVAADTDPSQLAIFSDGAATVWFTLDGTDPEVGGARSWFLPAASCVESARDKDAGWDATDLRLISAGTPKIRVQRK